MWYFLWRNGEHGLTALYPHERPCSRPVNEGEEDPCDIMHMESLERACEKGSMLVHRTDGELRTKDYEFANMKQAREAAQTEAQGTGRS
jgi:hypothetical protein